MITTLKDNDMVKTITLESGREKDYLWRIRLRILSNENVNYEIEFQSLYDNCVRAKKSNAKKKGLDFIPLNKYFKGSEAHHVNKKHVVYIPLSSHKKYPHKLDVEDENLKILNTIAQEYIKRDRLGEDINGK